MTVNISGSLEQQLSSRYLTQRIEAMSLKKSISKSTTRRNLFAYIVNIKNDEVRNKRDKKGLQGKE